jgi:hypothetical protein
MQRPTAVKATLAIAGLVIGVALAAASASALTLPSVSLTSANAGANASAGTPVATNVLLCGNWTQGMDRISGQSTIDHPSGASAMGNEYPYSGQNCESNTASSSGMFTWSVSHSNVNTSTERGTEHGVFMLSSDMNKAAGFNGHITNYDFGTPITAVAPDSCGSREIYYASGHAYDSPGSCSPSGPGNFNTHGGAATGDHFRGMYGTVVYQDSDNNSCQPGSMNYCFEAILKGQTN